MSLELGYSKAPENVSTNFALKKPKQEIGEYVRQQGILVPRMFSVDEITPALLQTIPVIARSEHPDEIAGPSGLSDSFILNIFEDHLVDETSCWDSFTGGNITFNEAFTRFRQAQSDILNSEVMRYCRRMGISPTEYLSKLDYSYWQFIPGTNVIIIEDDSIPNKYYLKMRAYPYERRKKHFEEFVQVDNGNRKRIAANYEAYDKEKLLSNSQLRQTIEYYNAIRSFSKLKSNAVSKMEFQIAENGATYFLQIHFLRNSRSTYSGENIVNPIETFFLRGTTKGKTKVKVDLDGNVYIADDFPKDMKDYFATNMHGIVIKRYETQSDMEFLARRYDVILLAHTSREELGEELFGHIADSTLFKPKLSIVIDPSVMDRILSRCAIIKREIARRPSSSIYSSKTELIISSDGRQVSIEPAE